MTLLFISMKLSSSAKADCLAEVRTSGNVRLQLAEERFQRNNVQHRLIDLSNIKYIEITSSISNNAPLFHKKYDSENGTQD